MTLGRNNFKKYDERNIPICHITFVHLMLYIYIYICVCVCACVLGFFVFSGTSAFVDYLMAKSYLLKNSNGTI